jgi:hypothetical protein
LPEQIKRERANDLFNLRIFLKYFKIKKGGSGRRLERNSKALMFEVR